MKIYLIRHGETVGNRNGFHQIKETLLTKKGVRQAKIVAKRLKEYKIDLIYSSTHTRAQQTSQIISDEINIPIELWEKLIEIRRPQVFNGKSIKDPEILRIDSLMVKNFSKRDWRYSDEENFDDITKRAKQVLDHLLVEHKNQEILCVTHGTFIKAIISVMLFGSRLTPHIFSTIRYHTWAENTGITIVEYRDKYGWSLNSWNDMGHL